MKEDINNIHDKFVRASFSDPERAAASFQTILPVELVNQIKWDTLKVLNESYIDDKLDEYFSDLVFEVDLHETKTNGQVDIVLLFEHKSSPDKHVLFQVGYYGSHIISGEKD